MLEWAHTWHIKVNISKSRVMELGHKYDAIARVHHRSAMSWPAAGTLRAGGSSRGRLSRDKVQLFARIGAEGYRFLQSVPTHPKLLKQLLNDYG
ncbi:hypothetical protein Y032_0563g3504 [Ancylostoma ceylanicum]|uniref:Uncharacterized protein n=2 Tax=Ancylostoma ceylanicum TaxID=53326 RepID=A0A016WPL0_9BILA|nr:hypothetical protein Y032_0563g3504 [Ancylostoma ceylanicum]